MAKTVTPTGVEDASGLGVAWRTRPYESQPMKAAFAAVFITGAAVLAGSEADSPIAATGAGALLVVHLRSCFFTTRYAVDADGISLNCLGFKVRRPWVRLRRFRYDDRGGFLSARSRPTRLDSLTGIHLTWGEHKDAAIAAIARHVADSRGV